VKGSRGLWGRRQAGGGRRAPRGAKRMLCSGKCEPRQNRGKEKKKGRGEERKTLGGKSQKGRGVALIAPKKNPKVKGKNKKDNKGNLPTR